MAIFSQRIFRLETNFLNYLDVSRLRCIFLTVSGLGIGKKSDFSSWNPWNSRRFQALLSLHSELSRVPLQKDEGSLWLGFE